ncbi:MAG TPA: hypothetical protein VF549_09770 [Solirubrobacteraceae bacterium]|jgi:hypothetical protein
MNRFSRTAAIPPQRPLTLAQERSLVALAALCPGLGEEASAADVAVRSGLRHGATTLALRGLERRRLVAGHGEEARTWAPTLTGRAHAKHLTSRDGAPPAGRPGAASEDGDARHSRDDPAGD